MGVDAIDGKMKKNPYEWLYDTWSKNMTDVTNNPLAKFKPAPEKDAGGCYIGSLLNGGTPDSGGTLA